MVLDLEGGELSYRVDKIVVVYSSPLSGGLMVAVIAILSLRCALVIMIAWRGIVMATLHDRVITL